MIGGNKETLMRPFVAIAVFLIASPAIADALPPTDSAKYCKASTAIIADGPNKDASLANCLKQEQVAHDKLALRWSTVPDKSKEICIQLQQTTAAVSYQGLFGCSVMMVGQACMDGTMTCK